MKGLIFQIQRYCLHDGPGIRTTVFFKGCPLRCRWCHNPESQDASVQEMAGETCGYAVTVEQVLAEVQKDEVFYRHSGGGITLSGGEPLLQAEFAYALLAQAKQNGMHTCIETCGYAETAEIRKIAEVTDLFLYDWKLTNKDLHRAYTGADNDLIAKNLRELATAGANIILRCPIVPEVNDTEEHFRGIAELANTLPNIQAIEIEPYHSLGNGKYQKLGRQSPAHTFKEPAACQIDTWLQVIRRYTATEAYHA